MRLIGLILLLLSSATCGQEGPLYLPEEYLPEEPNQAVAHAAAQPTVAQTSNYSR